MTTNDQPVVYVVDDDAAVRDALCALIASVHLPVEAYESAESFLAIMRPDLTGCLILDVRMPGMGGLDLQRLLKERGIDLPVIVITGHGDVPMAVRALKAGAVDFVEKPFNEQELLDRIHASVAASVQARRQGNERSKAEKRFGKLTPREAEVLEMLVAGQSSKRIATALGISERTVDVHRFNIMRKCGARNVAQLIRMRLMSSNRVEQ